MKILIALILSLLFVMPSYAVGPNVATRITAGTVTFNTSALIVTFNTIVTSLIFVNRDDRDSVHITLTELGWNQLGTEYVYPKVQSHTTAGVVILEANDSWAIDFATDKIGFITESGAGLVEYIATTETIIQP